MDPDRPGWPEDDRSGTASGAASDPASGSSRDGEPEPPPVPQEHASGSLLDPPTGAPHVVASVAPGPHRSPGEDRWGLRALALMLALTVGLVGGVAASELLDPLQLIRGTVVDDDEQDAAMVALLEDVVRTEGVMLDFNEVVAERLEGARGEEEALAIVARAAASGVGGLEALRPLIVDGAGGPEVEEVRTVYLPHLDSWIEYLSAIADEPLLLFDRDDQQPYILRINATADAFRIALEELLERGPSAPAARLAERILDDGFRSDGPDPTV